MQKSQYNSLVNEGFNHIPLSREVIVDTATPLALYLKLANNPFSYFLKILQNSCVILIVREVYNTRPNSDDSVRVSFLR